MEIQGVYSTFIKKFPENSMIFQIFLFKIPDKIKVF